MPRIKCGAHRNAEVAIPAGRSHKALHLSILNFSCNEHMFFFTKKKKKKVTPSPHCVVSLISYSTRPLSASGIFDFPILNSGWI